jgi:hypothetical protein
MYKVITASILILLVTGLFSCKKEKEMNYSGAYKAPIINSIGFASEQPRPGKGSGGDSVRFKVYGIDSLSKMNAAKIEFYFNGDKGTVRSINISDSTITAIVPGYASSGAVSMVIDDKIYYGPEFGIAGFAWIDSTFNKTDARDENGNIILGSGTNGPVRSLYFEEYNDADGNPQGNLYVCGDFTTWNGASYSEISSSDGRRNYFNNLIQLNSVTGEPRPDFFKVEGPNSGATLNGIIRLTQFPGFLIYGSLFTSYARYIGVRNMTRIQLTGVMDTIQMNVNNPNPNNPTANIGTFANYRGGFDAAIIKVFLDRKQRLITMGGFNRHILNDFSLSTRSFVQPFYTFSKQIAAVDQEGHLDETYNYDPNRLFGYGTNGSIMDAVQLMDGNSPGSIIIVGNFTAHNGVPAGRIAMLDDNGNVDSRFNIGSGANGTITSVTYNRTVNRILLVGNFTAFNGYSCPWGIIMLRPDGSVDDHFKVGDFVRSTSTSGQLINYAGQLNDGNIIVSGNFEKYKGINNEDFITRQGFMILRPDGTLTPNLNNTGAFNGIIYDIFESRTGNGRKAVVLAGSFSMFDNNPGIRNILRIGLERK